MDKERVTKIVEQCQQGDREAFGQLYTLMHDRLRTVCSHYVTDSNTADDLLHDAFLLIFSKISLLKDTTKAEAWMLKVTHNLARTYVQRHKQRSFVSFDEVKEVTIAAPENTAEVSYDDILRLVDQLPKSYRRVFRLAALEGLSHQQIAELLNIGPHTSSAQLFRAKKLLRQSLAILLLSLLTIGLPIGFWHLLQNDATPPTLAESVPESPIQKEPTTTPTPSDSVTTAEPTMPVANLSAQPQNKIPSTDTTPGDIFDKQPDNQPNLQPDKPKDQPDLPKDQPDQHKLSVEPIKQPVISPANNTHGEWTLAMAYSGLNTRQTFNLPYGEYGMNDPEMDTITHHRLPVTIALTVDKMLGKRLAIGTGLQYTQLYSETQAGNTYTWEVRHQRIHYLGIPLRATWYPIRNSRWSLSGTVQAMMELPLHATVKQSDYVDGLRLATDDLRLSPSLQWSAGIGLGIEYRLTPVIGLYAEPSLNYFFKSGDGIDTYRTHHPAVFSFPIGIRVTIK